MSQPYPIIEQRSLDPSQKRGFLGLGRRFREDGELPKPHAHHNLVYRVDGQYVLDNAELHLDAPQVTNATHVSLVDMTRDAAVMVQLEIPSADAGVFTMQVTFICTVNDPITVVREGLLRADVRLRSYLKSHRKLFELGLDYPIAQINDVRRIINAQVKAFTTLQPLVIPGISIEIASIEVRTPEELSTFEKSRRDLRWDHELTAERQLYGQTLEAKKQLYDQTLEYDRERHGQRLTTDARRHEQDLEAEKRAFERSELSELLNAVGGNPLNALYLAYAAGEIKSEDLFSKLMAEQQRQQEIERADRLSQIERDREDRQLELEQEREERRHQRDLKRLLVTSTREDGLRTEQWKRDDKHRQQAVNLDVMRELAKRGHLDAANPNVDQILADLVATPPKPAVESGPHSELTDPPDSERNDRVMEEG